MKPISTSIRSKLVVVATAVLWLVWLAPPLVGSEPGKIVDRLLLELNRVSYSQRYVEIYGVVKVILTPGLSVPLPLANDDNWAKLLDDFKDDLLIDQETKRTTGLNIDKNVLQTALAAIHAKSAKDPVIHAYFMRLGVDDETLRKAILSVLGVKFFLQHKQKKDGESAPPASYVIDKQAPWFLKLEQVTPYRFFEDAHKFVALSPMS